MTLDQEHPGTLQAPDPVVFPRNLNITDSHKHHISSTTGACGIGQLQSMLRGLGTMGMTEIHVIHLDFLVPNVHCFEYHF